MRHCRECEYLESTYVDAVAHLAAVQQRLACYRPPRDTEFLTLWARAMEALTAFQTLRDQMLWHFALHTASPQPAKAAAAS